MRRLAPRPIGLALGPLTERLAPRTPLARVQRLWEEVVGEVAAGHCRPVAERAGALVVACDEAVWAAELELLAPEVLERLAALAPELQVASMRCRTDVSATPK